MNALGLIPKVLIVLSLVITARAGSITFDPFPGIPADVTVQYFNGGLTGPLSSLPTPNGVSLASVSSSIPGGGNALLLYSAGLFGGPYGALLTFTSLQGFVSAVGNDATAAVGDNEVVYLTAFDIAGLVIGSSSLNAAPATPDLKPVSFSSTTNNIKYAAFTWQMDLGFYAVDNIAYSAVPEPGTMSVCAFMFAGLLLRRVLRTPDCP